MYRCQCIDCANGFRVEIFNNQLKKEYGYSVLVTPPYKYGDAMMFSELNKNVADTIYDEISTWLPVKLPNDDESVKLLTKIAGCELMHVSALSKIFTLKKDVDEKYRYMIFENIMTGEHIFVSRSDVSVLNEKEAFFSKNKHLVAWFWSLGIVQRTINIKN